MKKWIVSIILILGLCINCVDVLPCQASYNGKIYAAYRAKLCSINKKWNKIYSDWNVDGVSYFTYHDFNNDGIKELIIVRKNYGANKNTTKINCATDIAIYTYYNGKVKSLVYSVTGGGTWGGYYVHQDSPYIISYGRGGAVQEDYDYYKISSGKKKKVASASCIPVDYNNIEKGIIYKVQGERVKEKQYNSYVAKMGGKKSLKAYKITTKNIATCK